MLQRFLLLNGLSQVIAQFCGWAAEEANSKDTYSSGEYKVRFLGILFYLPCGHFQCASVAGHVDPFWLDWSKNGRLRSPAFMVYVHAMLLGVPSTTSALRPVLKVGSLVS